MKTFRELIKTEEMNEDASLLSLISVISNVTFAATVILTFAANHAEYKHTSIWGSIKSFFKSIKNRVDYSMMSDEEIEKVKNEVDKIKSTLSGAKKGVITKYQNKLKEAILEKDSFAIADIIEKFKKEIEKADNNENV